MIIGIAGQKQMGKTTLGKMISLNFNLPIKPLAAPVKEIFCNYFKVSKKTMEEYKNVNTPIPGFSKNVRQSLQFIGDGFRSIYPYIWIDKLMEVEDGFCVDDVRYINELKAIKEAGGINVLIYRPQYINNDNNKSESEMKNILKYFYKRVRPGFVTSRPDSWFYKMPEGAKYIDIFLINDMSEADLFEDFKQAYRNVKI